VSTLIRVWVESLTEITIRQLTAQELSTVIRNKLTPIVFVLNNDGYTIERFIRGMHRKYNDVASW
jgi:pyruvate decarboxylase